MLKKFWDTRWVKLIFSIGLLYLAFRKVEIGKIIAELAKVPMWFVLAMIVYGILMAMFGAFRWALVLFEKPSLKGVLALTRANFIGAFYGLFLPSSVGIDLTRWLPLIKIYPEFSKTKLVSSVLIDRIIGFSCFIAVAFGAAIAGRELKISYPPYLLYIFGGLFLGVIIFYLLTYGINLEKRLDWLKKVRYLNKISEVIDLFKGIRVGRLIKCFLVGVMSEFAWILPIWWWSLVIDARISLMSVMIIGPIIGLLLVLPISVAGFGARENLYLYFWGQLGIPAEKILLISTMNGALGILNVMLGGILSI